MTMSIENTKPAATPAMKASPAPRNGVDTPTLFATIGLVKGQPALAKFQFRATNRWINGTHSQTTIESFSGAGAEHPRGESLRYDADHPTVLTGKDQGPTPVEFLLHAITTCLTAGIANIAAARGVTLTSVESTVKGNIDLRGIFGLSNAVRNGYTVVIGGGQAGLAMSRCLRERRIDHVVLERGRVGERWRSERWDSLRTLTPAWQSRLPGHRYRGSNPDGCRPSGFA